MLHAHYKPHLQSSQRHVCSPYTVNGVTCLPDHPCMWLEWLDHNASSMCLDAFTPVFTAVHLWSHYQRIAAWAAPYGCCEHVCVCTKCQDAILYGIAIHGRAPQGENEGLDRECLRVGWGVEVMSAQHSTASKNDSRWSDTQPNSSHYHESTGWVECREKKGKWAKRAETKPDNHWWKKQPLVSLIIFPVEEIINTSWPHLTLALFLLSFHQYR